MNSVAERLKYILKICLLPLLKEQHLVSKVPFRELLPLVEMLSSACLILPWQTVDLNPKQAHANMWQSTPEACAEAQDGPTMDVFYPNASYFRLPQNETKNEFTNSH